MRKHLAGVAALCLFAVCLAACGAGSTLGALSGFTVTQSQLDAARSSYDAVVLAPAANYRALGYCATGTSATLQKPCADRAIVAKFVAIDKAVAADMNSVQAQITAGANTGVMAAWSDLQTQIAAAKAIVAQFQSAAG